MKSPSVLLEIESVSVQISVYNGKRIRESQTITMI